MFEFKPYSKKDQTRSNRKAPKKANRSEFSTKVRKQIKEHYNNRCAHCLKYCEKGGHVHHVWPRGRGGRGVFTNGVLLCGRCHGMAHGKNGASFMKHYIHRFTKIYGQDFYKDQHDLKGE